MPKGNWKARALAAEASLRAERAGKPRQGRPPAPAKSPDARLIRRVCESTGMKRVEVAERLGVSVSLLSRANRVPLAEHQREALRAILAEAAK